jgi:hypothetical protein
MRKPVHFGILCILLATILAGCGGSGSSGDGGTQPTKSAATLDAVNGITNLADAGSKTAVLKLFTSGAPDTPIAGIRLDLKLPDGTAILSSRDKIAASGVSPPNALFAANSHRPAAVRIALISSTSFPPGEFATLTLQIPAGSAYTADDFIVTGFEVIDPRGSALIGVSVSKTLTYP